MSKLRRLSLVPPSPRCEAGEERAGEYAAGRRGCSNTRRSISLPDYPELACGNASTNVVEGCGESGRNGTKVVAVIRAAGRGSSQFPVLSKFWEAVLYSPSGRPE